MIAPTADRYEALAAALEYPGPDAAQRAARCAALLANTPAAAPARSFDAFIAAADRGAVEELYTRTFDLRPELALDLGWQLFGESYKRGLFLVKMQAALRAAGVDPGRELPDHLPGVLRLLARLPADEARDLADEVLVPCLQKLLDAFGPGENPYRALLRGARDLLQRDFAIEEIRPVPGDGAAPSPAGMRRFPLAQGGSL